MCVLAFVGFGTRVPKQLQGLLGRCDWTPLYFVTLPTMLDFTVQPDIVVCNGEDIEGCGCADDAAMSALLSKSQESGSPMPLVVVGTTRFDPPAALGQHPVYILPRPGTYYERFGRLVHHVLRQSDGCCDN